MSKRFDDRPAENGEPNADPIHSAAAPLRSPKAKLHKVTLYVRPEQIAELEEIQLKERRRTGKRPDKSDLVQEALDLLTEKYSRGE